jgi:signal peptidase I
VTRAPGDGPARKSLWGYVRLAVSGALFILVVALGLAVIVIPAATKSVPLTVLTSSMEPGLPPGTLLIVRPVEPADIRIGDVVTYQIRSGEPDVITHRVTAITTTAAGELSFALQGDNNGAPDPDPVRAVQVQGRLWYSLPYLGWVNNATGGDVRATAIPIIAVACLLYAAWALLSGLRDRRKKAKAVAGASTGQDGEAHDSDLTPRAPLRT